MLTDKEKTIVKNLLADKIDLAEKHIRKFNKDYKYYAEDRMNWVPGEKLGSEESDYAKEIKRQINLEENKIEEYNIIINKIMRL